MDGPLTVLGDSLQLVLAYGLVPARFRAFNVEDAACVIGKASAVQSHCCLVGAIIVATCPVSPCASRGMRRSLVKTRGQADQGGYPKSGILHLPRAPHPAVHQ